MEVDHDNPKLEQLLGDEKLLRKRYGNDTVTMLARRMTSIYDASDLAELHHMPGRTHPLKGDRAGQFAMDLPNGQRLIIRPTHPVPLLPDGGINLAAVTRVTVVEITDHYT